MTTEIDINNKYSARVKSAGFKAILFIGLLICSLAVFLLGANYYGLFPTNGNDIYTAGLSGFFLIAAALLKRSERYSQYWLLAYAFFIASSVNLVSNLFIGYTRDFVRFFGFMADPNKTLALSKLYDTILVVFTILPLSLATGTGPGTLFLKKGNLNYKWGFGVGALVLANYFTSVLIFFGETYELPKLGSAIAWGILFSFSNSMLEELWIRGLFLKKLVPLLGAVGAVLLTSLTFAALHFLGVAYLPANVVPIFVVNTFTLGLACGILMLKTDSIWGAYLIHAAADLFLFIAVLAAH